MVELKKEAVKDVASLTKNSASSIGKNKGSIEPSCC